MIPEIDSTNERVDMSNTPSQEPKRKKHSIFYWLTQIIGSLIVIAIVVLNLSSPRQLIALWQSDIRYTIEDSIWEYLGCPNSCHLIEVNDFGKDNVISKKKVTLSDAQKSLFELTNSTKLKNTVKEYDVEVAWYVMTEQEGHVGTINVHTIFWVQGEYYWIEDISFFPDEKLTTNLSSLQEQTARQIIDYKNTSLVFNDYGELALHVDFTWTNTSSEVDAPYLNMDIAAFQNGIELYGSSNGSPEGKNIQPGYTVNLYCDFTLSDEYTPVEIVFYDHFPQSGNSYSIVIDPSTLQSSISFPESTPVLEKNQNEILSYDWIYKEWTVPHMASQRLEIYETNDGLELYVIDTFYIDMGLASEPDFLLEGAVVYYEKTLRDGSLLFSGDNCELLYDGDQITLTVDGQSTNYINL